MASFDYHQFDSKKTKNKIKTDNKISEKIKTKILKFQFSWLGMLFDKIYKN